MISQFGIHRKTFNTFKLLIKQPGFYLILNLKNKEVNGLPKKFGDIFKELRYLCVINKLYKKIQRTSIDLCIGEWRTIFSRDVQVIPYIEKILQNNKIQT